MTMPLGHRVFLFVLVILGAITGEEMLAFLPQPLAHACAFALLFVAFGFLLEAGRVTKGATTPWYLVAPFGFVVALAPVWVAVVTLGATIVFVMGRRYYRKRGSVSAR